jgi:hypothetical protein
VSAATVTEAPGPTPATVSAPDLLRAVRVTRALQCLLEAALWFVVGGSMLPFAAVHARAFRVSWMACLVAASIAVARAVAVSGLRQRLGPHRAALHASGRWVVVEPHPADRALGWSIDLGEPALPRGPLLLPGLAFLALLALHLVPLAGGPAGPAPEVTRRGITFVVACLLVHVAAAAAFAHRPARRRFRAALPPLLAIAALLASSSRAADDRGQLLAETGLPGLLIGLWTGLAALAAARRDRWLFAALAGGLMLVFVDFDAQVPAIAALFVALAALGGERADA